MRARPYLRACVSSCMYASMCACARACVSVCERVRACVTERENCWTGRLTNECVNDFYVVMILRIFVMLHLIASYVSKKSCSGSVPTVSG